MKPVVQISLDVPTIAEALELAEVAVRAGVDWLEAGTPLILGEGVHAITALKKRFPDRKVVADLKTMDGGYQECEMMALAGADMVVVMGQAHPATWRAVVKAARKYRIKVMGDIMICPDPVAAARQMVAEGIDYIIVHTGYDERHEETWKTPFDHLEAVVQAVAPVPVQAVGGLKIDQIKQMPRYGAPLVVVGAPLAIDDKVFRAADGDLEAKLREVVEAVRSWKYE